MVSAKKVPQRQCVGCGEMKNKKEMIRILKTPEGTFTLDITGRKNGFRKAVKGRGLERSFKMAIPKEVYETLEKEMEQFGES